MPGTGRSWSMKDFAFGLKMRRANRSYEEIATVLGRTADEVRNKLMAVFRPGRPKPSEAAPTNAEVKAAELTAIEDRARRNHLQPRTIVAAVLGDPLPGYSALDRKR